MREQNGPSSHSQPLQYRHGDVYLLQVAPPSIERHYPDHNIVAEGEATGHAHRLMGDGRLFLCNGELHLEAGQSTSLTHDEHARLDIPPGTFRVIIQREWSPYGETRVSD